VTTSDDYKLEDGRLLRDMSGDDVREVLGVFDTYDQPGASREDAMAHALEAWRACRVKRALEDRLARRRAEGVVYSGSLR
jgi:hypothetical protein